MKRDADIVETLIQSAGRRAEPPEDAYRQVFLAAHASFREKVQGRRRAWMLWGAAAATFLLSIAVVLRWAPPGVQPGGLATVARVVGEAEVDTGSGWQPLAASHARLPAGATRRARAASPRP